MPHTVLPGRTGAMPVKCAVSGCPRFVKGLPWAKCCAKHSNHASIYGSPTSHGSRQSELKKYREQIQKVLAKYADSEPVKAALLIADDVLHYSPPSDFTVHHKITAEMERLREGAVTARQLLCRVVEVYALQLFDNRYEQSQELDFALSRHVAQLRSQGTRRPCTRVLRFLGARLREDLGLFATAVCRQITRDDDTRAKARKAFDTGWTLKGEKA